jgi:hypothetical protein
MSAPLLNFPSLEPQATPPAPSRRATWLREPLIHFVVLGGVLFGADRLVNRRADDAHTIVAGADVDREAIDAFRASRKRDPNTDELNALRRVWLDNEILYREGLALGVDRGDAAIRDRVIFKALSVIDSNVKIPTPDDKTLRAWFEGHRGKYDDPERFDFEEAAMSGTTTEETVRAFVQELNTGTPGDAKAGLRVFKGRPRSNVIQSYGPDVEKELTRSKAGEWHAFNTRQGWRAMRLVAISPPKRANFEELRNVVLRDYNDAAAAEQRTAAVRALGKKYTIKHELNPDEGDE